MKNRLCGFLFLMLAFSAFAQKRSDVADYFNEDDLEDALICIQKGRYYCAEYDFFKEVPAVIGKQVLGQVKLVAERKHPKSSQSNHQRCNDVTHKDQKKLKDDTFKKYKDKNIWIDQGALKHKDFYRYFVCSHLAHLKTCDKCKVACRPDESCVAVDEDISIFFPYERRAVIPLCSRILDDVIADAEDFFSCRQINLYKKTV